MSHAGVKKLTLNTITPTSTDFFIVGVIIAKRSQKSFINKRDGTERGVWNFTLRDSPTDFINVTAWGSASYTEYLAASFRIGDVVDITNPKVSLRKASENYEDSFQPQVTSCMELTINEKISELSHHDTDDCITYIRLLHLPTKPPGNWLSISEVNINGKLLDNQYVNLLVAIQKIGVSKTFNTKDGREGAVMEIVVMDKTSSGFTIKIWDQELIERAKIWKPRDTMLFLSDIKVNWNSFRKSMIGTIGNRTIVTENPNTKEAMALAQFASTAPLERSAIVDTIAESMPLPETIVNVMSCEAVLNKANTVGRTQTFTALVYGIVENFNIDGLYPIISTKCSLCKKIISSVCGNPSCNINPGEGSQSLAINYDLRVTIVDFTNVLSNCRLTGNVAANVLGCSSEDFHILKPEEKVALKWKYLFKPVAARLVIMKSVDMPLISIVALNRISLIEFSQCVPIH